MRVLISAGETSSDVHGAELLKAIRAELGPGAPLEAFGIGGPRLSGEGLRAVVDSRDLLAMGSTEILGRLPRILRALRTVARTAERERPDVAVVIDYPDFHFRLARRLRRAGIPTVYYIPPKVWVWRRGRIRLLGDLFNKVLCIFPFEERVYRGQGVAAAYVGNPLADELPLSLSREEARARLRLGPGEKMVTLMPGSRPAEIRRHLLPMLEAATSVAGRLRASAALAKDQRLRVRVVLAPTEDETPVRLALADWERELSAAAGLCVRFELSKGDAPLVLRASEAGLIKSGTSTLEAGLMGCPHAVVYKPGALTGWIFRNLIRYRGPVGLVNLVAGGGPGVEGPDTREVFREILMGEVTAARLADELHALMTDPERRARAESVTQELRRVIGASGDGISPSRAAARHVIEVGRVRAVPSRPRLWIGAASLAWSCANAAMRGLVRLGVLRGRKLESRVVSVGNLEAGGTGKTPLVALAAREAHQRGKKVCILTRGYKGEWERAGGLIRPGDPPPPVRLSGDEAALLHDLAPHAWIAVGSRREDQYRAACAALGGPFDLVLLDDGFQHWRIRKDVEVVALTSAGPFQSVFRDFQWRLRSADFAVWTKGAVRPASGGRPLARARLGVSPLRCDRPVWLVTGVARGDEALRGAEEAGLQVTKHLSFPDHAGYSAGQVSSILAQSAAEGCAVAITGKDWVKWRELGAERVRDGESSPSGREVLVLEPEIVFQEGGEEWPRTLWDHSS